MGMTALTQQPGFLSAGAAWRRALVVWLRDLHPTVASVLIAAGTKPTFEELRKTIDPSTADATLRTQWARWRKFVGVMREVQK